MHLDQRQASVQALNTDGKHVENQWVYVLVTDTVRVIVSRILDQLVFALNIQVEKKTCQLQLHSTKIIIPCIITGPSHHSWALNSLYPKISEQIIDKNSHR